MGESPKNDSKKSKIGRTEKGGINRAVNENISTKKRRAWAERALTAELLLVHLSRYFLDVRILLAKFDWLSKSAVT